MRVLLNSALRLSITASLACIFSGCFKGEGLPPFNPPIDIRIEASVPGQLYSNKKQITLNAVGTSLINGRRDFQFLWTCPVFPAGYPPRIDKTSEPYTIVDSFTLGKYKFQLRVQDNNGHQATTDYDFEVLKDTLTGAPKLAPMPPVNINLPQKNVYMSASNAYDVNPIGRDLSFSWSLLQQPPGIFPPTLENKTSPLLTVSGLELGHYLFGIEIRNENGLSVSGTRELIVSADTLAGNSVIYEDIEWQIIDDFYDYYARLTIYDPSRFKYRSKYSVEVRLWKDDSQSWSDPLPLDSYQMDDYQIVNYYPGLFSEVAGKKTKVKVKFL